MEVPLETAAIRLKEPPDEIARRSRVASMESDIPDPKEAFETWLLRRMAQAVEAGDVSEDLLTELQPEFDAARGGSQEEAARRGCAGHRGEAWPSSGAGRAESDSF